MDVNREEKPEEVWFDLTDELVEDQCLQKETLPEPADSPVLDNEAMKRMKTATFTRLGLSVPDSTALGNEAATWSVKTTEASPIHYVRKSPGARRRISVLTVWAVVSIIIVAASLVAAALPEVRAQLLKAFQFIPGFASVQDTESHGIQYTLNAPLYVQDENGRGQIEIRGLSIGDNLTYATLTGSGGAHRVENLVLRNAEGIRYTLQRGTMAFSSDWQGTYYTYDRVQVSNPMEIWIDGVGDSYLLHLQEAQSAANVSDFGVSDTHGGINLTAISQEMEDGRTKISLVSQLPSLTRINAYGLQSFDLHKTVLTDEQGNIIPISKDEVYPNPNEFYYKRDPVNKAGYRLAVPELGIVRQFEKPFKLTIPIPEEVGETIEVNRTVEIFGHPVTVLRVKRINPDPGSNLADRRALLQIDFDMHFDPAAEESLLLLKLDYTAYRSSSGGSLKFNEQTGAMEYMTVDVAMNSRSFTMILKDASLAVRGPWEFKLP